MKSEEVKYAELFIAMSMDFLQGKIDLEHYANTLNMANEKFQNKVYENLTRQSENEMDDFGCL